MVKCLKLSIIICFGLLLFACSSKSSNGDSATNTNSNTSNISTNASATANLFNPYIQAKLPNLRSMSPEGQAMLAAMGGKQQSIEGEAAHRPNWRDEIYPVVYGDPRSAHEILVLIDFANPKSEDVWREVAKASKSISANQGKIVLFAKNSENYGTDLTGLAIWIVHSRKGQVMDYIDYALDSWNTVKSKQKKQGKVKTFTNEYDATVGPKDMPIHYSYFSKLRPVIPANEEINVARYCYDAGNVNMYQTTQIMEYFGVKNLPCVIVDGKILSNVSAKNIIDAMK